jgi:Xaa-Pro aminopeptidase
MPITLKSLQKTLKEKNFDGALINLNNLFLTEDVLEEENRIQALTGFSGSYAVLFVAPEKAYLFVDGRYELQAKKEVNLKAIEIVKLTEISVLQWLKKRFTKKKATVLFDPWQISLSELHATQEALEKVTFTPLTDSQPNLSSKAVKTFPHQKKFCGIAAKDKLSLVAKHLKEKGLDAFLITSPANVSWLLNLRSNALPYTPILRAYALITADGKYKLFAEHTDNKNASPFADLATVLPQYDKLGADFTQTPVIIQNFAPQIRHIPDIITDFKAVKNNVELKGTRNAHLRDGVALSKFLFWLSKNGIGKTETEIADKLLTFRQKEEYFFSESFAPIAGFGSNGAIVHYHASREKAATLKKNNLLLLDSGAQFFDGTTDVTRTVALGTPTPEMVEKNTLVLKSHIALATAVFPTDTKGSELDLIARQPLWKQGLDYAHGTGHGVGLFSDVHEGPARIAVNAKTAAPLQENMITSIEPGYYKENAFGIRIENLYYVKRTKNPKFLCFESLTLAPLDKKLINKYMLTDEELNWLNRYHRKVFLSLRKYLSKQELLWLKEACAPL